MVEIRLSLLFLLSCCVFATAVAADTDFGEWDTFKQRFGRRFGSASEDAARFAVFRANLRAAEALSASSQGARWGVTKFMDLTPAEFSASHGLLLSPTVPKRKKSRLQIIVSTKQLLRRERIGLRGAL